MITYLALAISCQRISANSFRGNSILCNVTFGYSTYRCGNYSREETIQGRKLFAEYSSHFCKSFSNLRLLSDRFDLRFVFGSDRIFRLS